MTATNPPPTLQAAMAGRFAPRRPAFIAAHSGHQISIAPFDAMERRDVRRLPGASSQDHASAAGAYSWALSPKVCATASWAVRQFHATGSQ